MVATLHRKLCFIVIKTLLLYLLNVITYLANKNLYRNDYISDNVAVNKEISNTNINILIDIVGIL